MIEEKLDILCTSDVIQEETKLYCMEVVSLLKADGIVDEQLYDTMITHIAFTIERERKQEKIGTLDGAIWQQIKEHQYFEKGSAYFDRISTFAPYQICEEEGQYIIMHICTLLEKQEEIK